MRNPHIEKLPLPQYIIRIVIALFVLGLGFGAMRYLVMTKPEPKKQARENLGELVEFVTVKPRTERVRVSANGQVIPARVVALTSEVGGRVVWLNENLIPGGRVASKDKIARIDGRDYSLAVQQQLSMVNSAQTALEVERSRKQIAEKEWQLMGGGKPADALALRDPQLASASASVKAAKSGLQRARLAVGKTLLKAPFNGLVQEKKVDVGQLVGPQVPLLTLIGTDVYWVQVSVPIDRLQWLDIPGVDGKTQGSTAEVIQDSGQGRICRKGTVLRLLGDLDPMGRMARVLIEINDPLLDKPDTPRCAPKAHIKDSNLPLLVGAYVSAEIEGHEIEQVIELAREAIRGGDRVYVMTDDDLLDIRDVNIVWRRPDSVLVASGLKTGERVVISPLSMVIDGMKLRLPKPNQNGSAKSPAEQLGQTGGESEPDNAAPSGDSPQSNDGDRSADKPSGPVSVDINAHAGEKIAQPGR